MPAALTEDDMMFSASNILPWHKLGTVVEHAQNVEEAIKLAQLDWTVSKREIWSLRSNGGYIPIYGKVAVVRDDIQTVLGIVGAGYECYQNSEGFELLDVLLSEGEVLIETAGSLHGGRTVWALARMPDDLHIGGEEFVPYLLWTSAHDGTMAVTVAATPVRVVCQNTLTLGLRQAASRYTARHTIGVRGRVQEAREALRFQWAYIGQWQSAVERLMETELAARTVDRLIVRMFPSPAVESPLRLNRVETVRGRVRDRVSAEMLSTGNNEATAWQFLNGVNSWELWDRQIRGDRASRQAMGFASGRGLKFTQQAFTMLDRIAVQAT